MHPLHEDFSDTNIGYSGMRLINTNCISSENNSRSNILYLIQHLTWHFVISSTLYTIPLLCTVSVIYSYLRLFQRLSRWCTPSGCLSFYLCKQTWQRNVFSFSLLVVVIRRQCYRWGNVSRGCKRIWAVAAVWIGSVGMTQQWAAL